MTKTLEVRLGDAHVGYLTNLDDDRTFFAFSDEYREMKDRPVLTQGLMMDTGELVVEERAVNRLAPPYFSNLLPEGAMRSLIARELGVSADRDFPLLEYLGGDHLIGAVRLLPTEARASQADPEVLALALPGVQMKLSAVLTEDDAITIPVRGQGAEWIVKVASGKIPGLVENEYSMLKLASHCGIEVPMIRLIDASSIRGVPATFDRQGKALAVRRFDRDASRRIHAEDFNQVFNQHVGAKYDNVSYGMVAKKIFERVGYEDAREFVRRVSYTAIIGNGDMHLKNWSLLYLDGRTPRLAPAYDYVSTLPYDLNHDLGLSFGRSKSLSIFTDERMSKFARDAQLPLKVVKKDALEMVERVREVWKTIELPLLDEHREILNKHIESVLEPGYEFAPKSRHALNEISG